MQFCDDPLKNSVCPCYSQEQMPCRLLLNGHAFIHYLHLMLSLQWWLFKKKSIIFWWQRKAVTKRQTNFFHLLWPLGEDRGICEAKVRSKTHVWFSTVRVLFGDIYMMWTCTSHAFLKAPLILSFFFRVLVLRRGRPKQVRLSQYQCQCNPWKSTSVIQFQPELQHKPKLMHVWWWYAIK